MRKTLCYMAIAVMAATVAAAGQHPWSGSVADAADLWSLAILDDACVVKQVSSYDRTGGNDDGFSGKYSYLYIDDQGRQVVFDEGGPGCIYRIWSAYPPGGGTKMLVYVDGKLQIESDARAFFQDTYAPFMSPVTGLSSGGWYSYFPIPYAKSCKIVMDGPEGTKFWQVQYATFTDGRRVRSFTRELPHSEKLAAAEAYEAWRNPTDPSPSLPADAEMQRKSVTIHPGHTTTLFAARGGGDIGAMRFHIQSHDPQALRKTVLRAFWDGEGNPSVESPFGDFFGCGFGPVEVRAMPVGHVDGTYYSNWRMPFDDGARITIENGSRAHSVTVSAEIWHVGRSAPAPDLARFHAQWIHRTTEQDVHFVWLDTEGRGHFCGVSAAMQGPENISYLEGDEKIFVDGEEFQSINGTGTEDYFNCGWYFNKGPVTLPWHGIVVKDEPRARINCYRFQITDRVPFRQSILAEIEHGPGNDRPGCDYATVVYWYQQEPHTDQFAIESAAELRYPPKSLANPPHFIEVEGLKGRGNVAPVSQIWEEVTEEYGGGGRALLPFKSKGQSVTFDLPLKTADSYEASVYLSGGPGFGQVVISVDGTPVAEFDAYRQVPMPRQAVGLGVLNLPAGSHTLTIKAVGKHVESDGYAAAIDAIELRSASPFCASWKIVGPFPDPKAKNMDVAFGPELDPHAYEYDDGVGGEVAWGLFDRDRVEFNNIFKPNDHVIAYAKTWVWSPQQMATEMLIGSDDGVKVWLNGRQIHKHDVARGLLVDADRVPIRLTKGWNFVLVKVDQEGGGWSVVMRIRDPLGELKYSAEKP